MYKRNDISDAYVKEKINDNESLLFIRREFKFNKQIAEDILLKSKIIRQG